ncbi:MAG: hypothetical protein ACI97A_002377 [Planctomycetota bacterium]
MKIRLPISLLGRIGKVRLNRDTLWFAAWGVVLLAVEFSAPVKAHDAWDLLRIAGLGFLIYVTAKAHSNNPLALCTLTWMVLKQLGGLYKKIFFEVGVDLRGTPPIPRMTPKRLLFIPATFLTVVLICNAQSEALSFFFQDLCAPHLYLVNLVGLTVLWTVLIFVILIMSFLVLVTLHDGLVLRHSGNEERSTWPEVIVAVGAIGMIAFAGFLMPLWFATAIIAIGVLIDMSVLAMPGGPRLTLLWQTQVEGKASVRSLDWRVLVLVFYTSLGLFLMALMLVSCGSDVTPWAGISPQRDSMPVTRFLGVGMAWCSAAGISFYSFRHVRVVLTARNDNPSTLRPAILGVRGSLLDASKQLLRRELPTVNWLPQFEDQKNKDKQAIEVDVIEDATLMDGQAPFAWPPCITVSQLLDIEQLTKLGRRHDLKCRRNLTRGLERVFKKSARRRFDFGAGFYVAPHLWWVPALQRDDDEEGTLMDDHVGPYFNRVMSLASRHHFYLVMKGLELDIIFVEDGVNYKRFRRVLRRLFELYDSHDGQLRTEDQHFSCQQGTRVLIHDHVLDNPFKSDTYPEPDYAGLGRARVLHVYRDRGGDEEESPMDSIPNREFEPIWA